MNSLINDSLFALLFNNTRISYLILIEMMFLFQSDILVVNDNVFHIKAIVLDFLSNVTVLLRFSS